MIFRTSQEGGIWMYPFPGGMTSWGETPKILGSGNGSGPISHRKGNFGKSSTQKYLEKGICWFPGGYFLLGVENNWRCFKFKIQPPKMVTQRKPSNPGILFGWPLLGMLVFGDVWLFYLKVGWLGDLQYVSHQATKRKTSLHHFCRASLPSKKSQQLQHPKKKPQINHILWTKIPLFMAASLGWVATFVLTKKQKTSSKLGKKSRNLTKHLLMNPSSAWKGLSGSWT